MKLLSKLALAAALAAPSITLAQDNAGPNQGALSFSGGVDFVTAYYFRGYLQENAGLIAQPYFGASFNIVESDDVTIGASASTWNSFHSKHTGSDGDGAGAWFENDISVALPIAFGDFVLTPTYYLYQYPNGAAETIQEVALTFAYDDSKLWANVSEGFKLNPYITVAYEFDDAGGSEDTYAEIGITPGYTFKAGDVEVPLEFPISLGMSLDDYYVDSDGDNEFFGYLQVGVATSISLESLIPAKYGAWSLDLGGYYQYLFADSVEVANNDSEHVFWGKVGISFTY